MSKLPDGAHFQIRNKMGTSPTPPPKICGNDQYKSKSGKYKHKKNCLINCAIIEKKENSKLKIELNKEVLKRKELQKQVEELLLERNLNSFFNLF